MALDFMSAKKIQQKLFYYIQMQDTNLAQDKVSPRLAGRKNGFVFDSLLITDTRQTKRMSEEDLIKRVPHIHFGSRGCNTGSFHRNTVIEE
jgi:hypothetical protein